MDRKQNLFLRISRKHRLRRCLRLCTHRNGARISASPVFELIPADAAISAEASSEKYTNLRIEVSRLRCFAFAAAIGRIANSAKPAKVRAITVATPPCSFHGAASGSMV